MPTKPHIYQPNDESNAHLLYEEVLRKLDQVLNSQEYLERRFTSQEVRQESLEKRFSDLEEQVFELRRTVRGSNGDRGVVADVAVMQETLRVMKDDLTEIEQARKEGRSDDSQKYVSFYYLVDKFGLPVVTAFLLWFLLTLLPTLIKGTP